MDKCVERITSLILEKGYTNRSLADHLDIPPSLISDWKSGKSNSYFKYIAEMSDFFGVSADYLLGRTPVRAGVKWDDLIKQYQLCESDKQSLVDRLLGITHIDCDNSIYCSRAEVEEDMSMIVELVSMFDELNIVGKSRIISMVADELDKIKTTTK